MTRKLCFLEEVDFNGSPHVRAKEPDPEIVQQYAQAYLEKKELPPVVLFYDRTNKRYLIADGRHRCAARVLLNRREIMAEVQDGDINDALRYALTANTTHGVPRSNADKRQCIIQAIKQWPDITDTQISKMAEVDNKTVTPIRQEMEKKKQVAVVPVRTTKDGRQVTPQAARNSQSLPPAEEGKVKDALGIEIPKKVLQYWERTPEIVDLVDGISSVIRVIKLAGEEKDLLFAEVNITGTISDLEKALVSIRSAIPYAVCPQCQGHPETQPKGCRLCYGRGILGKWRYEKVAIEVREMQEKRGKK